MSKCVRCGGTGLFTENEYCFRCGGSGKDPGRERGRKEYRERIAALRARRPGTPEADKALAEATVAAKAKGKAKSKAKAKTEYTSHQRAAIQREAARRYCAANKTRSVEIDALRAWYGALSAKAKADVLATALTA